MKIKPVLFVAVTDVIAVLIVFRLAFWPVESILAVIGYLILSAVASIVISVGMVKAHPEQFFGVSWDDLPIKGGFCERYTSSTYLICPHKSGLLTHVFVLIPIWLLYPTSLVEGFIRWFFTGYFTSNDGENRI